MTITLIATAWIFTGSIGSILGARFLWLSKGHDVSVSDLLFFAGMTVFGPLNLVAGIVFSIGYALEKLLGKAELHRDKVIIRAKRRGDR